MAKYTVAERTLLMQMAEFRADQVAWETIAQKLGQPLAELKVLQGRCPGLWKKLLNDARRELLADANQEAMQALLHIISKNADDKTVLKATTTFARLAQTQAKITDPPKPKAKPKAKEPKPVAAPLPSLKPIDPVALPQTKLPNGTMAPPPTRTAS